MSDIHSSDMPESMLEGLPGNDVVMCSELADGRAEPDCGAPASSGPFLVGGKEMQRVILHTPEPFSSAALYVDELSRALTSEGIPVHLVCPENHQARRAFDSNPMITVHPTAARSTDRSHGLLQKLQVNARFLCSSCAVLFRSARRGDLVHFQYSLHLPFGALLFGCARLRGCKIVYTAHDPLPHKWLMPKFRWIERLALAWMYRVSDNIIVHSDAGKRTIVEGFGQSGTKVKVIPHGPYELGTGVLAVPKSEYMEVLLFGAIRENKGAHLAIEAVQQLHREGVPVRLTIAGSVLNRKEQGYWNKCQDLIRQCPQPIRVIDEFIPDEKLPELFAGCHCFLLPYTEFFSDSGVAFMALANGRPIISTKAGGLSALLDASKGGLVIEEASVNAIAAALRRAVTLGADQMDRLGRAGSAWVLQECGWPKIARETGLVYKALLKRLSSPVRASAASNE
jgi:glycosyltransferase involved in cell wall biosynthesis